ncbi:phosphatidylinositol-binding protein scs2, partial [Ascosphaera aggregata]
MKSARQYLWETAPIVPSHSSTIVDIIVISAYADTDSSTATVFALIQAGLNLARRFRCKKCRDKFLVQAVSVPADKEFSNVSAIWQEADANRDSMKPFERKIKVAFLPALDEEQQQEHVKRGPPPLGDPPAYNANPVYESHIASNPLGIANTTPSTGAAPPPSSPPPPAAAAAATTTTP